MLFDAERKYREDWKELNAWWTHSGDPKDPHVILSGGDHATLFMNNGVIAQQCPSLYQEMMTDLVKYDPNVSRDRLPDFVVAPAVGGIQMAYAVALAFNELYDHACAQYFTDKVLDADGSVIGMEFRRGAPSVGQQGIVYDDVTTTLGAIEKCAEAIIKTGATLTSAATTLNRSPYEHLKLSNGERLSIHALVSKEIRNMPADSCPLCQAGSRAVRPKKLWSLVTGK